MNAARIIQIFNTCFAQSHATRLIGGGAAATTNLPDAKDDDIIARQLREAAMQETDPELKEKLWDEYRRYKKG